MDSALELEFKWRLDKWAALQALPTWPNVTPNEIRELKLYSGAAGIYRDAERTKPLIQDGITVSILNTSGNYTDEVSDDRLIYSYPRTLRKGQDEPEVQSLKNAMVLGMPIFVLTQTPGNLRNVRLGWVEGCEDSAFCALVKLDEAPEELIKSEQVVDVEFAAKVRRKLDQKLITKYERDPKFKFKSLSLYKGTCAVTDLRVERMLDAAHIVPVAESGSDDPRNSLLINSAVHRAFDSHYWAIEPDTLKLATRKVGPTLEEMKIKRNSILHLESKPHPEALEIRWQSFVGSTKGNFEITK
jgi:putative restriction endonuclease